MKLLFLAVLFLIASTSDFTDEVQFSAEYQANVCDGTWPNYKVIEVDCERK